MPAPETLRFTSGSLVLIDQTQLPVTLTELTCVTVEQVHDAIRRLVVRGAPAIGIAAAYGVCLAGKPGDSADDQTVLDKTVYFHAIDYLATSRPTAVNLFWALDRMRDVVERSETGTLREALVAEATAIHEEDRQMCHSIGRNGSELLRGCKHVLTHCNAGGLATSTWGTALAPVYHLHAEGTTLRVFADETRPLLQGARLTAWELAEAGVPVTVITDSMAGSLMRQGNVDAVIVGADRIAACGDRKSVV